MVSDTEYPQMRESRRMQAVVIFTCFLVAMGSACLFALSGAFRLYFGVPLIAFIFLNTALILWPISPRKLSPIRRRAQPGNWSAFVRAVSLPELSYAQGRLGDFTELPGRISLKPDGIVWEPTLA